MRHERVHSSRIVRRRQAYTLLELLLVLGLILIVASLSVPSLTEMMSYYRSQSAADQWITEVRDARLRAMETGLPHGVTYIPESDRYSVWSIDALGNRATPKTFRLSDEGKPGELSFTICQRDDLNGESKLRQLQAGSRNFAGSNRSTLDGVSIVFSPDGSANQDQCVWIGNPKSGRGTTFTIQALTGTIQESANQ